MTTTTNDDDDADNNNNDDDADDADNDDNDVVGRLPPPLPFRVQRRTLGHLGCKNGARQGDGEERGGREYARGRRGRGDEISLLVCPLVLSEGAGRVYSSIAITMDIHHRIPTTMHRPHHHSLHRRSPPPYLFWLVSCPYIILAYYFTGTLTRIRCLYGVVPPSRFVISQVSRNHIYF
jgi:hypothetical protein